MMIKRLSLANFRRFETLDIDFHDELTVIVARNGQGKSTVLDAATVALSSFVGAFDMGKAKGIYPTDARYLRVKEGLESEQQYPVTVQAHFIEPEMNVSRERTSRKGGTTYKDASEIIGYGKKLMQQVRDLKKVSLPVVAYYGSGRLWNAHKNMERKAVLSESRSMGYEDCLSPASSFKQLQQWMAKATYAVLQQQEMSEYSNYTLPEQVEGIKKAVNQVLDEEGWQNFHYSFSHEELAMYHHDDGVLPVSLLSDGVRAMVSLTADLAWRCAKLNPHLGMDAPTITQGIVFIDEVDMHLHPAWQQKVIRSLQNAFPKIQLIATTHSPQVLSTVEADCIRILVDGEVFQAPKGTKGAESSRILKRVLGVDTRPPEDENTKLLNSYLDLVYADKWTDSKVVSMRKKLDDIYDDEEPTLTEADIYIENREWELEIEKNQ